jgi:formylglycine-generating enzyme required for sulfatase activity
MVKYLVKGGLTVLGAVFLSTLGIYASDSLQGIDSRISNLAGVSGSRVCDTGSVLFSGPKGDICVDAYEASPSSACPYKEPMNVLQTEENANTKGCEVSSREGVKPWGYITLPQAQRACALTGKRLPTHDEWYRIALGTDSSACTVNEKEARVTGGNACQSGAGAYDVVGNMWEWIDVTVQGSTFEGRALPNEGYVTSVDADGVAITSDARPDLLYGEDYIWSKSDGVFGMIRGGFYGSGSDAGIYTVNAGVPTGFSSQGVGFRCVEDV